jgi:hypothetical protein
MEWRTGGGGLGRAAIEASGMLRVRGSGREGWRGSSGVAPPLIEPAGRVVQRADEDFSLLTWHVVSGSFSYSGTLQNILTIICWKIIKLL